jgi:predicted MFS family arabinose efflux permease
MGFNSPSLLSAISQLADPRDQGSTLGVSQSLGSLARIIGPLWGGWVFDQFGIRLPFVTSAAVMFLACVLSVVAFSRVELGPARPTTISA